MSRAIYVLFVAFASLNASAQLGDFNFIAVKEYYIDKPTSTHPTVRFVTSCREVADTFVAAWISRDFEDAYKLVSRSESKDSVLKHMATMRSNLRRSDTLTYTNHMFAVGLTDSLDSTSNPMARVYYELQTSPPIEHRIFGIATLGKTGDGCRVVEFQITRYVNDKIPPWVLSNKH